ncbi:MAG: P-loop ATPase [Candidatus Aenigmarchaeota archaeon ex4484_224]|nr:MAG: P-loop ATPase [Candidatus Aenigmarchaeota archaeon ex4484_224]
MVKIIAVSGVKGGVGKSSVAILLSLYLSKNYKVLLADLDVECPNDYILLIQKLEKEIGKVFREHPVLIKEKCKKCGICAKSCNQNAIFWVKGKYPIFIKENCIGCGLCQIKCPFGAIKMKKEEVGKVFLNKVNENLYLLTGVSKEEIEETGDIVKKSKEIALEFCKKEKIDYLIIDTGVGMHCNVIHALINSDLVLLVSEPTPLGAYDLDLALKLTKRLKLKTKVILNKAGIGDEKFIERIAKKNKVEIALKIPFSIEFAKTYSQGKILEFKRINWMKVIE